jgi:hypothetical protein
LVLAGTLAAVVVVGVLGGGFSDPNTQSNRGTTLFGEGFDVGDPDLLVLLTTKAGSVGDPAMAAAGFPLVCPTEAGGTTYTATDQRQGAWVNRLVAGLAARTWTQPHACWTSSATGWRPIAPATPQRPGNSRRRCRHRTEPVKHSPPPWGRGRSKR